MSGVAGLYNVPSSAPEFQTWSFIHAAHHVDINRILYQLLNVSLDAYVLDPFDPTNPDTFLQNHQTMHKQMDAFLGISGYNLLSVDMTDEAQFANWIALNADEHFKAANILGLG